MTTPTPAPITDHELLIRIHNQNAETIKVLKSINGKLTFFVVILVLALIIQFLASFLSL